MGDIARRHGLNHVLVSLKETAPVTPEAVRRALEEHPDITHLAMVHCETTTGILNPVEAVARAIRGRGLTFIVDAMSSFGGIPIDIRKLGIDFLVSSANKCIQGVPGFGFVIARRSSLARCEGASRSLSLDLYDQWAEMEKGHGKWRFTSPTHVVRAFFQAMKELEEEGGVEARHDRYRKNHAELVEGMRRSGFRTLLPDELQSPIITSFLYPEEDFDFQKFYEALKERGFVIYPGKISEAPTFRIGNIGDVFPDDFRRLAEAVADIRRSK
jgi:2-aminoethylphosphonate-pyruvate transaminase